MPSKSQTKSKQSKDSSETSVLQAAPVEVAAPVVVAPVVVAVVEPVVQTGGANTKKAKTAKLSKTDLASASASASAASASAAPIVVVPALVELPVVEVVAQAGGGKKQKTSRKKSSQKSSKLAQVEDVKAPKAPKTTKTPKTPKASKGKSTDSEENVIETNRAGKVVRSFKVMLPGVETYEGRFTGLTPYQAANKALSKYFRETEQPKKQISFTIRESTRGSKRSTYTYNGKREKLSVPVEYAIKDGRTIIKNFKNRLVKVKKNETSDTNTA